MAYYAHKRETADGQIIWQTVWEHLTGTAQRAGECLRPVGLENAAYLAGMLHDIGKFTTAFQQYLAEGDSSMRGRVIHSFHGCRYLLEQFHRETDPDCSIMTSELLAFAVGAHHGLFDCVDPTRRIGLKYRSEMQGISYEESVQGFFAQEISQQEVERLFSAAMEEINRIIESLEESYADDQAYFFVVGLMARLLLSAVIEGDRQDTAAFMDGYMPQNLPEDMTPIWSARLAYLEEKMQKLPSDGGIANARRQISEACRAFADKPSGIYRLNVPTGGGKTLSSLRYALAHAKRFNKKRLIFTSPLLSILEQNAGVIRTFVGEDRLILEHHSNFVQTEALRDALDERELLVQNWNAPIILTSLVQLLNTLFDGKTTSIRRFQALCDSVIVIDEVQTIPVKLLSLFNLAIQFLSEQCGATIVLCSATQPCLEKVTHPLRHTPEDIVSYDKVLWAAFQRTELQLIGGCRLDELPDLIRAQMKTTDSLLVVCNKKSEAAYLLKHTRSAEYRSFHLSAAMCMRHRRDVLSELQAALARGEKVLCIATQVIEAGVDISFATVLRFIAGMDSVVQAAGRCNRNGESETLRPVYAVNCTDEKLGMLRDIQRGKDATLELMDAFGASPKRFDDSLFSDASIRYYYCALYRDMAAGEQDYYVREQKTTLLDLMAVNEKYADVHCSDVSSFFLRQAFKTAGQYFSVFEEDTTDILVPYGDDRRLVAELCSERCKYDAAYRTAVLKELGQYSVSVYQYQKTQLEKAQALVPICEGCALVLAEGFYDADVGLTAELNSLGFLEV